MHQLKYLGYLKLIGSGYNWCHWSPIRWDPCGALNLDVQDVYANGCTVNGTVQDLELGFEEGIVTINIWSFQCDLKKTKTWKQFSKLLETRSKTFFCKSIKISRNAYIQKNNLKWFIKILTFQTTRKWAINLTEIILLLRVIWISHNLIHTYDIYRDGIILCKLMEVLRKRPLKGRIIVKSRLNWVTANGNIAQAMSAMKEDGISLVNIGKFSSLYLGFLVERRVMLSAGREALFSLHSFLLLAYNFQFGVG